MENETLPVDVAFTVVQLIDLSNNWMLSPIDDGCFRDGDEALAYVQDNPSKPLRVVACHVGKCDSESILVTYQDGEFGLDGSECMGSNVSSARYFSELVPALTALFNDMVKGLKVDGVPVVMETF